MINKHIPLNTTSPKVKKMRILQSCWGSYRKLYYTNLQVNALDLYLLSVSNARSYLNYTFYIRWPVVECGSGTPEIWNSFKPIRDSGIYTSSPCSNEDQCCAHLERAAVEMFWSVQILFRFEHLSNEKVSGLQLKILTAAFRSEWKLSQILNINYSFEGRQWLKDMLGFLWQCCGIDDQICPLEDRWINSLGV